MEFSTVDTAVVFIDPQVDVPSPNGKNWVFKGPFAAANLQAEFDSRERVLIRKVGDCGRL